MTRKEVFIKLQTYRNSQYVKDLVEVNFVTYLINQIFDEIHLTSQDLRNKFIKEIDLWEEINIKENPSSFVTATRMRSIVEEYHDKLYDTMEENNQDKPSVSNEL